MTFEPTLPLGEPDLMRVSDFRRYLDELVRSRGGDPLSTRLSSLSPSLTQDLLRFGDDGHAPGLLEVLAASVRHGQRVAIHLRCGERVLTLTVFPFERLAHCPLPSQQLLAPDVPAPEVLQVEPALLRPPGDRERSLVGEPQLYRPLGPLAWQVAMHGARHELLPEIAGPVAYRAAPTVRTDGFGLDRDLALAVERLQDATTVLREIAQWPGMGRERASRLLNALYLQGGLIVSRTHPAATNDGWFALR